MNKTILRIIIVSVVIAAGGIGGWIMLGGIANGGGEMPTVAAPEPDYQSGPFHISVSVQPKTPKVGKNRLTIRLQDADGHPVTDARIKAMATMPAMGAMPAMQAPADLEETEPGL